jgi:OOP family OmpA-OmpF porin
MPPVRDTAWEELRRLLEPAEDERLESLARSLPHAVQRSLGHGPDLRRSLQPHVREAVVTALKQDSALVVEAVLPVIGTLIRRYIATAMQEFVDSVNLAQEQSVSMRSLEWRLEALRTGRPFGEIVLSKSLLYRVEQVFLIHRDTGLLLCHRSAKGVAARDADMVSGMLTAIGDFVRDSFASAEGKQLEIVQVGDLRVWARHGTHSILAGVVRGVAPPQLGNTLERALAEIERDNTDALAAYNGDSGGLDAAAPALEACLLGRGSLEAGSRRNWPILAALCGIVAVVVGLWAWNTIRWNRQVAAFREEPGYAVTLAGRGWWRHRVEGLRDPLAAPVESVALAGGGMSRIDYHWEPFASLHPRMVALREFDPFRRRVDAFEIAFAADSAQPGAARLAEAAALVSAMIEAGKAAGRPVVVEVTGGADATGTADRNRALVADRTRAVMEGLVAAGVGREWIRAGTGESTLRGVRFRVVPR